MSVHSACLDYRFRMSQLQLSEFSKLSYNEKLKMIESNNILLAEGGGKRAISYFHSIIKDLGIIDKPASLKNIENILIT